MTISNTGNRCRNCGEKERLQDLGFVGQVAPFFLKRVFGMKLGTVRSVSPWKQMIRQLARIPQVVFDKLNPPATFVEIQLCETCSFVQAKLPFQEEAINCLYLDYREDSYNRERIEMEPSYAPIAADVGHSAIELETRISAATNFLKDCVPVDDDFTILDFGGSDGKFMPRLEGKKFVFEISNVQPIEGITRIHSDAELGTYSLVQLAHVIEHVVEPLALVKHVATKVANGGYLYVETPQELSAKELERLKLGLRTIGIHEHINSYCIPAVTKLIENAGLHVVAIEATLVDVGWGKSIHIRALGQKI